jgi:hypothetical protein
VKGKKKSRSKKEGSTMKQSKRVQAMVCGSDKLLMLEDKAFLANKPQPLSMDEWNQLLKGEKDIKSVSKDRIRQSIVGGINPDIRGQVWCLLCDFDVD